MADVAAFLARRDPENIEDGIERFKDRASGWLDVMMAAADLHPITCACMGFHLWSLAGLVRYGDRIEAAVTAARVAASDGSGAIFAPLAMGGAGAVVGTRFLVADEIWAHANYKDRLVASHETDTALCMQSLRNTVRGLANETMTELARVETETPEVTIQDLMPLVSGQHSRRAYETGDSRRGVLSAGQSLGMVERREPLADIVAQMEAEMRAAARSSLHLFEQA